MKVTVAIATAGRRGVLSETLEFLHKNIRDIDEIVICPARENDVDRALLFECFPNARIVTGDIGSSPQRNAIMDVVETDLVLFLDDDFLPADDYIEETRRLFQSDPGIIAATGHVIRDGIIGPGLSTAEGIEVLEGLGPNDAGGPDEIYNVYGCNMIIRVDLARQNNIRFDENLPLYAWQEDLDFSRQLAPFGRIVIAPRLRGVHLGTKRSGRSPGKRLGYSQIANPIYLATKGTLSWRRAVRLISRNIASNAVKCARPEPWIDRRGRLWGNVIALGDLLLRRLDTRRVLDFE